MATITIRNLKDEVRDALRVQAAKKGRSLEAEARAIIESQVEQIRRFDPAKFEATRKIAQDQMRAANGGKLPTVDDFLAEKRAEAAREVE